MEQQHMITEMNVFDNPLMEQSIFGTIDAVEDQSADIYAAVIDNAVALPDDDAGPGDLIPIPRKRYSTVRKVTPGKAKSRFAKRMQALLQEEHALWLK